MSFVKRKIGITIQKSEGTFGQTGTDTVSLQGLRVSVTIKQATSPYCTASVRIWGLSQQLITDLATFGFLYNLVRHDTLTITAGDVGMQPKQIFVGTVIASEPDFQGAPNVPLNIEALLGAFQQVDRTGPQTVNGPISAASLMKTLADKGGYSFENSGVNITIPGAMTLTGSLWQQMQQVKDAGNFNFFVDETNTLAIWPKGKSRQGNSVTVAPPPQGNMIGYPSFGNPLLFVKNLFDPSVRLGTKIQIQSSLKPANGTWYVQEIMHELEAELPGGKWHSTYGVYSLNLPSPTPPAAT
jgi:hypothetical protein